MDKISFIDIDKFKQLDGMNKHFVSLLIGMLVLFWIMALLMLCMSRPNISHAESEAKKKDQ